MPKISVIIPIYNVEKYLKQCLNSVINQTLKDIEIICINDGSTDNSLKILKEYSNDTRIFIIDKENEGVSVARNIGIDKSIGTYLCFLDADDWLEPHILENSLNKIIKQQADIICFGIKEHYKNYTKIRDDFEFIRQHYNKKTLTNDITKNFLINACAKLYKTDFIKTNSIYFMNNLKTMEDGIFNLHCFYKNPKYSLLNECGYNYRRQREGAVTNECSLMIKTDIEGAKKVIESQEFLNATKEQKIITIENFILHFRWNFSNKNIIHNIKLIQNFKKYLYKNVDISTLKDVPNIKDFKRYTLFRYILQKIFNIRNKRQNKEKIKLITLLGITFEIKRT